jgi:tripartite-type tricarboxylate transporter receptor subunit TctC
MIVKRHRLLAAALTVAALGLISCVSVVPSQEEGKYPRRTIRMVVPYAAGGPTDVMARAIAPCFETRLGKTVIVVNKPGGSSAIGVNEAVHARDGGHTVAVVTIANLVLTPLISGDVGYSGADMKPLGQIYELPSALIVRQDAPFRSASELLAAAKGGSRLLTVATPGAGTVYNPGMQDLQERYGVALKPVPFNGTAEVVSAVLGGNVDAAWVESSNTVRAQLRAGKIRILATGAVNRVDSLPDVPTLAELGYPGLPTTDAVWFLGVGKDVSRPVSTLLTDMLRDCLYRPDVLDRLGRPFVPREFVPGETISQRMDAAEADYTRVLGK